MTDPIDRYVDELAGRLPRAPRLKARILTETETHLREPAREAGPQAAIERFGPAADLARRFGAAYAAWYSRVAALATAVVLAGYFLVLYPIPENTLPPAPWPEGQKPDYLAWKQTAALVLYLLALVAGTIAVAALRRNARVVAGATAMSLGALTAASAVGTILAFQWADAVPGTSGWLAWLALATFVPVAFAAALLARALVPRRL
jgi:hypothetical protein